MKQGENNKKQEGDPPAQSRFKKKTMKADKK